MATQPTIDLSAGLMPADSGSSGDPTSIDLSAGLMPVSSQSQPTATISAIKPPAHIGEALEQWADNVANDVKNGTDHTGIGSVLKSMGAHGVYAGNPEAVGDFIASLPLGVLKAIRGGAKVAQGKVASGAGDIVTGAAQAATIPAAFVAPEESALSKEGLLSDAAAGLNNAGKQTVKVSKDVGAWMEKNKLKSVGIELLARELGVDPAQLARKAYKYGHELFGD